MGEAMLAEDLRVAPEEEPYPTPRKAWTLVVVLCLLYVLSILDRQVINLLIDDIRADLRINDLQVSLLQGLAFALFYVTFGLVCGRAVDRHPRRLVIALGVGVWSVATAACGVARTFVQLGVARLGVGAGEAALLPAAYSMIADSFPKSRLALAMSVFGIGATLGYALSTGLGGLALYVLPRDGLTLPFLGHMSVWRLVFLVIGLPGLVLSLAIFLVPEPARRGMRAAEARPTADTLRYMRRHWRFFTGHFAGFGLQGMCIYGLMGWQAMYLHRNFGWDIPTIAAVFTGINFVTAFTAVPLTGHLIDRWVQAGQHDAPLRWFTIAAVVEIALVLGFAASPSPIWACVALFGVSVLANCTGPAAAAVQMVAPSEFRGQLSAAYILVYNLLGAGLGASVVAAFTTLLFRDDSRVGWSVFLTYLIFMPLSIVFLRLAMAPMRKLVAEQGTAGAAF
jgi:MFS family permease